MKILFIDQSGKLGGAELCLLDVAKPYRDRCLVGLLADGSFRELLEQNSISVMVLTDQAIQVQKHSGFFQGILSFQQLVTPLVKIIELSRAFDLIYANTQKALVVSAIASLFSHRPLVYHLHDIISLEHFSRINQQVIVQLANRCAKLIIANSQATRDAFIQAGGNPDRIQIVYNGFDPTGYDVEISEVNEICRQLKIEDKFVIGHFSRLSPWKGQHILIEALAHCAKDVVVLLVGDALFGEQDYVASLHRLVRELDLQDRVKFLGFRSTIPPLMTVCDLVAHTSTAPEPFGRVIVEAMLCGRPVVATAAGGATELVKSGETGWLMPPGDPMKLVEVINEVRVNPVRSQEIAHRAQLEAIERFNLEAINQQIMTLLQSVVGQ